MDHNYDKENIILCNVCNRDDIKKLYNNFYICLYCFHTSKHSDDIVIKPNFTRDYNVSEYHDYILSEINNLDIDESSILKILVINDRDTKLIDNIYNDLLQKRSKYSLKTVSLSTYYNNSFFSPHFHNKYHLSDYITDILKDDYESFDIIILNEILTYDKNIRDIMSYCKRLSNEKTVLFSINLNNYMVYSSDIFKIDRYITNLFTTNSFKRLCSDFEFNIQNSKCLDKGWFVYKFDTTKQLKINKDVVNILYDEMVQNIYDGPVYNKLSEFWSQYISTLNETLNKYKKIGYNIIIINTLQKDMFHMDIPYDSYIKTDSLLQLEEIVEPQTLLVILDTSNLVQIKNRIKNLSSSSKKWLVFDIEYMIAYNV
jgi:hypothetical protein